MSIRGVIDVHQHLWTPRLRRALRERTRPPLLAGWTLHLPGADPWPADPAAHDVDARAARNAAAGVELALVALSSGLGVEWLPPGEAAPLLQAYHDGALELPAGFGAWAAANLTAADPDGLAELLDAGFVGLELAATALADPAGYDRCAPLLEVLADRGAPLFVHPGTLPTGVAAAGFPGAPGWWPAVVDYVQQMHAAWHAFRVIGRSRWPDLRVCFALLAGLAPLHGERLRARGGDERGRIDPEVFVETSSYGPRAIDATVRVLGVDVVLHGSDLPYADPPDPLRTGLGAAADAVVLRANALRLLAVPRPPTEERSTR